ncbi:MAG: glycosyltransferase family 10 [Candidatus Omnitrophota bacterium]
MDLNRQDCLKKTFAEDLRIKRQSELDGVIVGYWSYYENQCLNNQRFLRSDFGTNENCLKKYNELYARGREEKIHFLSLDLIDDFSKVDLFVFSDVPKKNSLLAKKAYAQNKPMFLILEESAVVYPRNWDLKNHEPFEKILTWDDRFVDNKKYFKFNHYFIATRTVPRNIDEKKKLCVTIAANKKSAHPLELYSERERAIRWFEKYHPEDFDLYGFGWDERAFPMDIPLIRLLNGRKMKFLRKYLAPKYPSWRGTVKKKSDILGRYWFSICYENARDITGYILEKIFDCFFCGTVPVYRGADNIGDYIPKECYLDQRDFKNYDELYDVMKRMSREEYLSYLDNIEAFLNSEAAGIFSSEYFVGLVLTEIRKSLNKG